MDHNSITSITPATSLLGSWCRKKASLGRGEPIIGSQQHPPAEDAFQSVWSMW